MYTPSTTGEKRAHIPGVQGIWFATPRPDGSLLLRRHGKVSHADAITDIIIKPQPANVHVHVLGNDEAIVLNQLSDLPHMIKEGRLNKHTNPYLRARYPLVEV